jgi:arylsulfatase A-like enzyme
VTHHTDLLPTIVAAAGGKVDPAWHIDGANMVPVWTGNLPPPERTLFWEWRSEGHDQIAAMRDRHKLVITRGGKAELFDVEGDPAERRDIAAGHPDLTRQLKAELESWLETETRR